MRRYLLHSPFNIYHFEAQKWQHPVHKHTYFEIIFILQGRGLHNINGNTFEYAEGDVFLLGPEDFHDFEIAELTEFCFIRFNESFSKTYTETTDRKWQQIFQNLLFTSSQSRGSIVKDKAERQKLLKLLAVLEEEYENNQSSDFEVIRDSLMQSMMVILARNLSVQTPLKNAIKDSVEDILMYIKQNIYSPSKLSIERIADEFNLSPTYISIFFKRHTGESLKQYISKHKQKLIESRLIYSKLSLTEIAYEFGFTDESHFCKQFKKFTGSTPTEFRKLKE